MKDHLFGNKQTSEKAVCYGFTLVCFFDFIRWGCSQNC